MKQNESLKTKENFFDPNSRNPVSGGGIAINRREYNNKSFNLLSQLLLPYDQKKIERTEREAEEFDMSFSSKKEWEKGMEKFNNDLFLNSKRPNSNMNGNDQKKNKTI